MKETVLAVREMDRNELELEIEALTNVINKLFDNKTLGPRVEELERATMLRAHYKGLLELHVAFYGGTNG